MRIRDGPEAAVERRAKGGLTEAVMPTKAKRNTSQNTITTQTNGLAFGEADE